MTERGGHEWSRGEPARSTQGATDVLHEQDKVQVVGRAGLELGYEVEVEISPLLGLGVNQQARAPDVGGELDQADEDVLEQASPEPVALVVDVDAEPGQQSYGLRVATGPLA
jgi:hypothetical protein